MKQLCPTGVLKIWIGLILLTFLVGSGSAWGARLKDIASLKGVRPNQLVGYGLVVGLAGTGDGSGTQFTVQSLVNMLRRLGVDTVPDEVKVENVAAVIVTAELPPFARLGSKVDVLISSIGDAESLQGGTLLMTPLKGADERVYAVAQGPLVVGGFVVSGAAGGGVGKNITTVGRISGGATIEREIPLDLRMLDDLVIALHKPDFTTALRVSEAINHHLGGQLAVPRDAGTVTVGVPGTHRERLVELMASLEHLDVKPDTKARIVVNGRTGTVIMGENVRIASVAVAHGNISVEIKEQLDVSQPRAFSDGETVVTPRSEVNVSEENNRLILMPPGTSLGDIVKALNAIGVTPRDLISILDAMRSGGALHAELEII